MNKILKFLGYKTQRDKWDIQELKLDIFVILIGGVIIYVAMVFN